VTYAYKAGVLDAVRRAGGRARAAVLVEMRRGLGILAGIAATAPFVGVFGTIEGILGSFRGGGGEKFAMFGRLTGGLADSLIPTALAMVVALFAWCCYKFLCDRLDGFDLEMENASVQVVNALSGMVGCDWTGLEFDRG
jgi:biopolymer transport protein ExbB/TolQ